MIDRARIALNRPLTDGDRPRLFAISAVLIVAGALILAVIGRAPARPAKRVEHRTPADPPWPRLRVRSRRCGRGDGPAERGVAAEPGARALAPRAARRQAHGAGVPGRLSAVLLRTRFGRADPRRERPVARSAGRGAPARPGPRAPAAPAGGAAAARRRWPHVGGRDGARRRSRAPLQRRADARPRRPRVAGDAGRGAEPRCRAPS